MHTGPARFSSRTWLSAGTSECNRSLAHASSPLWGHSCPAVAEEMPPRPGQHTSGTCITNTHLTAPQSWLDTVGTPTMSPISCPEGCGIRCPPQGPQSSGPSHKGCPMGGAGTPRPGSWRAGAEPCPKRCPSAPLPHTHWSCASLTRVYCFIANRVVTKREEGPRPQGPA